MFLGAGAWGARYVHGGFALAGTNGRATLNDHRRRARNNLRIILVLCDGKVCEHPRVTGTAETRGKRVNAGCGTDPRRTLIGGVVNEKVEVVSFSKAVGEDDLLLEVENRYPSTVESDPRLCSLGRELVENGGRHKLRKKVYTNKYNWGR